jgi:hypothetical protein
VWCAKTWLENPVLFVGCGARQNYLEIIGDPFYHLQTHSLENLKLGVSSVVLLSIAKSIQSTVKLGYNEQLGACYFCSL